MKFHRAVTQQCILLTFPMHTQQLKTKTASVTGYLKKFHLWYFLFLDISVPFYPLTSSYSVELNSYINSN